MTSTADFAGKKVCIVGLGYIGLPTAAILARRGYEVHGVDVRPDVIDTINRGEIHIHEPGLAELVSEVVEDGKLRAGLELCDADIFFVCVPTPFLSDKSPDLSYVQAACEAIRPFVRCGNIIILESTSPPKTTEEIVVPTAVPKDLQVGRDVFVAYCPERVLPGRILIEAVENDRIVGGITTSCTEQVKQFYETFVEGEVLTTSAITAEITKLTENSYRDVNIAFANELSMLADSLGANPFEAIELANRHPRVNVLQPGPGVGGHCISVDPWFLAHAAPNHSALISTARNVNDSKPEYVVEKVLQTASTIDDAVIGCLGLAYKADVDDMRESPSLEIAQQLTRRHSGQVLAADPYVSDRDGYSLKIADCDEVIRRSDVIVLLTDHSEFRGLSADNFGDKTIIDTRNLWELQSRGYGQESAAAKRSAA